MSSSKKNKSKNFNAKAGNNNGNNDKNVKKGGNKGPVRTFSFPAYILGIVSVIYAALLFVIFPLYYEDMYYNMGDAKWHFFKTITFGLSNEYDELVVPFTPILVFVFIILFYVVGKGDALKETLTRWKQALPVWICLAVYITVAFISTIATPYGDDILWGRNGWYMGILAQTAFVVFFFVYAFFGKHNKYIVWGALISLALVSLIGIGQRFNIDPLHFYDDLTDYNKKTFISTLGQTSWFSSSIILIIPVACGIFVLAKDKKIQWLTGILVFIEGMTLVVDDSDAGLLAFFGFISLLFIFSFKSDLSLSRFFALLSVFEASFIFVGLLQKVVPDAFIAEGSYVKFLTNSVFIYIALIIDIVLAVVFKKFEKEKKGIAPKIKVVGVIYAIMLGLGAVLLVVYVILNTKGMAGSLSSSNSYLYFDEYWGNNRGLTWISAVNAMKQAASADPVRLLIGAGPDQFNAFVYEYCGAEMEARWSAEGVVFGNAHNEWLSELITLGFIGGIAYIGVFISSLVLFLKKSEKTPELLIPAMCIVAYMMHNFFCYQQILCTPAIFIIMGLGVQLAYQGNAFFKSNTEGT